MVFFSNTVVIFFLITIKHVQLHFSAISCIFVINHYRSAYKAIDDARKCMMKIGKNDTKWGPSCEMLRTMMLGVLDPMTAEVDKHCSKYNKHVFIFATINMIELN